MFENDTRIDDGGQRSGDGSSESESGVVSSDGATDTSGSDSTVDSANRGAAGPEYTSGFLFPDIEERIELVEGIFDIQIVIEANLTHDKQAALMLILEHVIENKEAELKFFKIKRVVVGDYVPIIDHMNSTFWINVDSTFEQLVEIIANEQSGHRILADASDTDIENAFATLHTRASGEIDTDAKKRVSKEPGERGAAETTTEAGTAHTEPPPEGQPEIEDEEEIARVSPPTEPTGEDHLSVEGEDRGPLDEEDHADKEERSAEETEAEAADEKQRTDELPPPDATAEEPHVQPGETSRTEEAGISQSPRRRFDFLPHSPRDVQTWTRRAVITILVIGGLLMLKTKFDVTKPKAPSISQRIKRPKPKPGNEVTGRLSRFSFTDNCRANVVRVSRRENEITVSCRSTVRDAIKPTLQATADQAVARLTYVDRSGMKCETYFPIPSLTTDFQTRINCALQQPE